MEASRLTSEAPKVIMPPSYESRRGVLAYDPSHRTSVSAFVMTDTRKTYNPRYFDGTALVETSARRDRSFRHFVMEDGFIVGMFQGERGDKPEIDFIIKFLEPGERKRLRTPQNMHWVVDLLLKKETHASDVCEIVRFYRDFYDRAPVLASVKQRNEYELVTPPMIKEKYKNLKHSGTYSIEYLAHVIELFTLCEKVSPREKKMFKELLNIFVEYCEGTKDFYQVMGATSSGY
jgi:hypothetical protein